MSIVDRIEVPAWMQNTDALARGYAWCRTLTASASLLTLLLNPANVLFAPVGVATRANAPGWTADDEGCHPVTESVEVELVAAM